MKNVDKKENRLEAIKKEIDSIYSEKKNISNEKNDYLLNSMTSKENDPYILSLNQKNSILSERIALLKDEYMRVFNEIDKNTNFNKFNIFENIRFLLRNNENIKIGQIETNSGNQIGYMSRIEKMSNKSTPNFEFITKAAEMLDVSIDLLTYSNLAKMTETELYFANFINKLIKNTRKEKIVWKKETEKELDNVKVTNEKKQITNHPLFIAKETFDGYHTYYDKSYNSLFNKNEDIKISGNCFNAKLDEENRIYIMSCKNEKNEYFYELYIIDFLGNVNCLCCSKLTSKDINRTICNLFNEIVIADSHVHLDDGVHDIIDSYMRKNIDIKE